MQRVAFIVWVLTIFALPALSDPQSAPPAHPCVRADRPVDPSQALSAFEGLPRIYLRDESLVVGQGWRGVDDLSATARVKFDDQRLYLLVEVMDNDLQFPAGLDEYTWNHDSIQIAFDPLGDGGAGYSPDDAELLMTMIDGKAAVQYRQVPHGVLSDDAIKQMETFAARHPHVPGWYFFAAIPWKALGVAEPALGQKYGIDILVNDRDAQRERLFIEWTRGIGLSKDPSAFGQIEFVEKLPKVVAGADAGHFAKAKAAALTEPAARQRADKVRQEAARLNDVLAEAETAGLDVRDQRITYHAVLLFADYAVDDVRNGKARRGGQVLEFIETAVPRAIEEVKLKIEAGAPVVETPANVLDITWRNGHFYSGERPVFLYGIIDAPDDWAAKLGLNYAYGWTPLERLLGNTEQMNLDALNDAIVSRAQRSRAAGLAVSHLLGLHYFPKSLYVEFPETRQTGDGKSFLLPCLDSPLTMRWIATVLRQAPPELTKAGLLDLELANEPGYACRCAYTRQAFVEYLRSEYESPAAVAKAWGMPLKRFEDAPLPPEDAQGAMRYDWYDFNQRRVARVFAEMSRMVADADPKLATEYKVVAGRALDGSDLTWGIDHEAIAQASPSWTGCDTYFSESGISRAMIYDLYRSLAAGRPIVDHECPYVRPGATAVRVRFNLWVGALHGESGAALWIWSRAENAPDNENCIATQPWSIEALGRTIGEVNRLAPEIVALSQVRPQVLILYSRSSSIMSPRQHLGALNQTYRDVAFLGAPVGFITERQLASRHFADAKVILVPAVDYIPDDALAGLREFSGKQHGTIMLTGGDSAFKTERDVARGVAQRPGGRNVVAAPTGDNVRRSANFANFLDRAGVARVPDARPNLEVRQATMPDGSVVRAYLNYGDDEAKAIRVPEGSFDLIAGKPTSQLSLPRCGVALVRLAKSEDPHVR